MAADVRGALTHQEPSPGVGATGISRGDRPSAGELRLWGPREGPGQRLSPDSASSLKRAEHGMRDEVVGSTHVHPTTKLDLDVSLLRLDATNPPAQGALASTAILEAVTPVVGLALLAQAFHDPGATRIGLGERTADLVLHSVGGELTPQPLAQVIAAKLLWCAELACGEDSLSLVQVVEQSGHSYLAPQRVCRISLPFRREIDPEGELIVRDLDCHEPIVACEGGSHPTSKTFSFSSPSSVHAT